MAEHIEDSTGPVVVDARLGDVPVWIDDEIDAMGLEGGGHGRAEGDWPTFTGGCDGIEGVNPVMGQCHPIR